MMLGARLADTQARRRVDLPVAQEQQRIGSMLPVIEQEDGGPLRHAVQLEPIFDLVRDQDGVPGLELPDPGRSCRNGLQHRGQYERQHFHLRLNRAISPLT